MKKGILLTAAFAALAPLAIVAGSAQAATDFTPQLVYTFNAADDDSYAVDEIASFGDKVAVRLENDELWVSDGTEAGTKSLEEQMVAANLTNNFYIERSFDNADSLDIDGVLYFFGEFEDTVSPFDRSNEIFKTNGTTVTRVTTGLNENASMYYIDGMIYVIGDGVFQVNPATGAHDKFYPSIDCVDSGSTQMQMVGGKILFIADDDNCDEQLFAWDPTTPNVDPVAFTSSDGGLGANALNNKDYMDDDQNTFTMFNGEMYFSARANVGGEDIGTELFKTDGTQAGTVLVKDLYPGAESSYAPNDNYMWPTVIGDEMFFTDTDGDMWKTDGTSVGTVKVIDDLSLQNAGGQLDSPAVILNGKMITGFYNDTIGDAVYSTDGTVAGTELLVDPNPNGTDNSLCYGDCVELVNFEGHLFFIAYDGTSNNVWVTDGTPAGTRQISTFASEMPVGSDSEASLVVAGDSLYFGVDDSVNGDVGTGEMALYKIGGEGLAPTGADLSATSLSSLVAMALVALAGAAVIARRRITKA